MPIFESIEIRKRQEGSANGVVVARIDADGVKFATAPVVGAVPLAQAMFHPQTIVNVPLTPQTANSVVHTFGEGIWRIASVAVNVTDPGAFGANVDVVKVPEGMVIADSPSMLGQTIDLSQQATALASSSEEAGVFGPLDAIAVKVDGDLTGLSGNITIFLERIS